MRQPSKPERKSIVAIVVLATVVAAVPGIKSGSGSAQAADATAPSGPVATTNAAATEPSVDLTQSQLNAIKMEQIGTYTFPVEKEAVGNIAYVDDLSVQVFPPYQGKLLKTFAAFGDNVKKGQILLYD